MSKALGSVPGAEQMLDKFCGGDFYCDFKRDIRIPTGLSSIAGTRVQEVLVSVYCNELN